MYIEEVLISINVNICTILVAVTAAPLCITAYFSLTGMQFLLIKLKLLEIT